jgi:D-xylose reductase
VDNERAPEIVQNAIDAGVRLFDCAADYGNEKGVGQGLSAAMRLGRVRREELFITSKLWNSDHSRENVRAAARRSMADLQVDFLDLYLIHFPIAQQYVDPRIRYPPGWLDEKNERCVQVDVPLSETWAAMEALVDEGLVRNIGVCNFQGSLLMDLLRSARIKPAVLQIEHHPYLVQQELLALCARQDIAVTAYFSFGPTSYMELARMMQDQQNPLFANGAFDEVTRQAKQVPPLLAHARVEAIARAHGKTPAQVLLRWATQRGIAVIPKTVDPDRLRQNLNCSTFDLTDEEMKELSGMDRGMRFNNPATVSFVHIMSNQMHRC